MRQTDGHPSARHRVWAQQLTWNDQGKLAAVIDNQGDSSSYAYDADGNLLLQTDNKTTNLYLPDEQIVADTSTTPTTITGTRYYTLGGITVAARTSAGTIQYLTGDQHDTDTAAIDSVTLAATHRYYTPFGALRWPYPSAWPGTKGFAGGTTDTVTALTNLGAREYNPGAGTFTSPDPLLTPYNPQNLNPYAYANNNPATNSDPTGLSCSPESCTPDPGGEPHPGTPAAPRRLAQHQPRRRPHQPGPRSWPVLAPARCLSALGVLLPAPGRAGHIFRRATPWQQLQLEHHPGVRNAAPGRPANLRKPRHIRQGWRVGIGRKRRQREWSL